MFPFWGKGMRLELLNNQVELQNSGRALFPAVTILFVHGSMHSAHCWEYYMKYFSEHDIACNAISLRGHGDSEGIGNLSLWTMNNYLEDINLALEKVESPVVLVGHSMGGMLVQKYIEKYNNTKIIGAVLMSCTAFSMKKTVARTIFLLAPGFLRALFRRIIFDRKQVVRMVSDVATMKKVFFTDTCESSTIGKHHQHIQNESLRAIMGLCFFKPVKLVGNNIPLLFLVGGKDKVVKREEVTASQKHYRDGSGSSRCIDMKVIDECAHDIMLNREWRFGADHIVTWLNTRVLNRLKNEE